MNQRKKDFILMTGAAGMIGSALVAAHFATPIVFGATIAQAIGSILAGGALIVFSLPRGRLLERRNV